jgi:hypothetical protein
MSDPLEDLAWRATAEPVFLGARLAAYQVEHGLSDLGLARELGCTAEALTMLRLCRAPREGADGAEDLRRVAERFGCDPARLAAALGLGWE